MRNYLTILLCTAVWLSARAERAAAQPAQAVTVGIYAPSVEFGGAQARLAYAQGVAKAIEQSTGLPTEAQSYATIAALKKDNVDFAIIDGLCYATNLGWRLLATANLGGGATRTWALYSSVGDTLQQLKGKKLAFIATGCNDAGFVDNAMLDSEVDAGFFAARSGNADLTGAVAEVVAYKASQAVFAPIGSAKGLTKVFDTGAVANPGFVAIGNKLPAAVVEKVAAVVVGYSGAGAIAGWTRPNREVYTSLAARLGRSVKSGIPAAPEVVRIDAKDALIDPPTLKDTAVVDVRHLFVRASGDRME
jgi:hypothetical protein